MEFCSEVQTEPLEGSAKRAAEYVLLEYTAAWGDDVKTTLRPTELDIVKQLPTTYLIRKPGRAGHVVKSQHTVYTVDARAAAAMQHTITDITQLPTLTGGALVTEPVLLVCTHAKRDRCCAVKGRPIAAALAQAFPDAPIWECSHTKGHRFAPSLLLLPWGYSFGRLNIPATIAMYQAAQRGELFLPGNRGSGLYTPREQVVELAVAHQLAKEGHRVAMGEIQVAGTEARVRGRIYTVVLKEASARMQPSCGKSLKQSTYWVAEAVHRQA